MYYWCWYCIDLSLIYYAVVFGMCVKVLCYIANREDIRTANIIADDPDGVDCLVLDRE